VRIWRKRNVFECHRPGAAAKVRHRIIVGALCALLITTVGCNEEPEPQVAWTEPFDAYDMGWFLSVNQSTEYGAVAVGGTPSAGIIMRMSETQWASWPILIDVPLLNWIHSWPDGQVVVVGNGGTILRYDGSEWALEDSGTEEDLWGVWGASSDDLWAVGGRGREEGQATILRNTGEGWFVPEIPDLDRPHVFAFYKVWGSSKDDVYVVGQQGAVLHWTGTELVEQHISLWGTGPDRIVAVGGRSQGIIARYDGVEWTTVTMVPPLELLPGLNGVWMQDPDTIHIAGSQGVLATVDFDSLGVTEFEVDVGATLDFHALQGGDDGHMVTVGGNFRSLPGGPYHGVVMERFLSTEE
jgi:hypothetical protein